MTKRVNFGVIEVHQEWLEMIEVFDRPAQADMFEIVSVNVSYKDVGGKLNAGKGLTRDFTADTTFEETPGVEITYGKA